jgi:hypothetical protein
MNIFLVDTDPIKAAQALCDKHCIKMILETAQLLSTSVYLTKGDLTGLYKPTHLAHPCTKWASESKINFNWLKNHGLGLLSEYTFRYRKEHKSTQIILKCTNESLPDLPATDFVQVMPEVYRRPDPTEAYRAYYNSAKYMMATWTRRQPPEWWCSQLYVEKHE